MKNEELTSQVDTTQYRLNIWNREYSYEKPNLPSTSTDNPSRVLVDFLENYPDVNKDFALDLGSGNGRNSFYLANNGYQSVLGIEFSDVADKANQKVGNLGLEDKVKFLKQSLGIEIPIESQSADLIIDMMVMHSLNAQDRVVEVSEIKRILKPGGYFIFYTIAAESEAAQDLIKKYPGSEWNSYRFETDSLTITEKAFTKEELEKMLEGFKLIRLDSVEQFTPAFGDVYKRIYYAGIFRRDFSNETE